MVRGRSVQGLQQGGLVIPAPVVVTVAPDGGGGDGEWW